MENKKKFIIIAIILFIFLGLTIFTFANPSKDVKEKGNGKDTEEKVNSKDKEKEDKDSDEESLDSNINNQVVNTNAQQTLTEVQGMGGAAANSVEVDDGYEKALEAVIEAEKYFESNSYDNAQELVDKVTDETKKQELQDRLDEVKEGIDVKELVENLKSMTTGATSKSEMDDARTYRTAEDIVDKVAGLSSESLKDELNSTLEELAKLLNDETNPTVSVNDEYAIVVENEDEYKITVKLGEESFEVENGYVLESDGVYTITVVDAAFNETIISYTKDTTAPEIILNGPSSITLEAGVDEYIEYFATVKDNIDGEIPNLAPAYINYSVDGKFVGRVDKVDINKPGTYKVVYQYTDKAGNVGVNSRGNLKMAIRVVIVQDTTSPIITLNGPSSITLEAGVDKYTEYFATVKDNVDEDINDLAPAYINYSVDGKFVGKVDEVDINKPGTYKVVYQYTDKAGNVGKNEKGNLDGVIRTVIVQDTTAPEIEEIRIQKTGGSTDPVNLDGTLLISVTVKEKLNEIPEITINEKTPNHHRNVDELKLQSGYYTYTFHNVELTSGMNLIDGEYIPVTVTVKDEYGNSRTITTTGYNNYSVKFDVTEPTISFRDYNRSPNAKVKEQSITADITEKNIKSVKYLWFDKSRETDLETLEKLFTDNADQVKDVDLSTLTTDGDLNTVTITNSELNGKYYFYLRVEDKAGNVSILKSAAMFFDNAVSIKEVRVRRNTVNGVSSNYAMINDTIEVSVFGGEELNTENKKLYFTVGDSTKKNYIGSRQDGTKDTTYLYHSNKVTLTDDMNLTPDEPINIKIYAEDTIGNTVEGYETTGTDDYKVIYYEDVPTLTSYPSVSPSEPLEVKDGDIVEYKGEKFFQIFITSDKAFTATLKATSSNGSLDTGAALPGSDEQHWNHNVQINGDFEGYNSGFAGYGYTGLGGQSYYYRLQWQMTDEYKDDIKVEVQIQDFAGHKSTINFTYRHESKMAINYEPSMSSNEFQTANIKEFITPVTSALKEVEQTDNQESVVIVTSENDIELTKFLEEHPSWPKEGIIWWAEFSCDITKCEGFNEHGSDNKTDKIVEARRGDASIVMEAPAAKEGYKFAGWEVKTVDYYDMKIQGFEATYVECTDSTSSVKAC